MENLIGEWFVRIFFNRNYIENFGRKVKVCLGLGEYKIRNKISFICYFFLFFMVFNFIIYLVINGNIKKNYV